MRIQAVGLPQQEASALSTVARNDHVRREHPRADGAEPDNRVPTNSRSGKDSRLSPDPHVFLDNHRRHADRRLGIVTIYAHAVEVPVHDARPPQDRTRSNPDLPLAPKARAAFDERASDLEPRDHRSTASRSCLHGRCEDYRSRSMDYQLAINSQVAPGLEYAPNRHHARHHTLLRMARASRSAPPGALRQRLIRHDKDEIILPPGTQSAWAPQRSESHWLSLPGEHSGVTEVTWLSFHPRSHKGQAAGHSQSWRRP